MLELTIADDAGTWQTTTEPGSNTGVLGGGSKHKL
jgi:hypothetical protein